MDAKKGGSNDTVRHTAALPNKYLTRNLDVFNPPVLATKITNSPTGDSIQGHSDYIPPTSRPPHVMPPSHTDQIYAPRWPIPVSTSVLAEDLGITDPRCSNDTCRAFREGFADDERKTPLLGLISYVKWTVWFYSIWILLFTAIYVSHLLCDRLRRLKRLPGQRPSLSDKAIAFIRFWAYRRLNNYFTRKIGLRQISYGTLALLAISTVFYNSTMATAAVPSSTLQIWLAATISAVCYDNSCLDAFDDSSGRESQRHHLDHWSGLCEAKCIPSIRFSSDPLFGDCSRCKCPVPSSTPGRPSIGRTSS